MFAQINHMAMISPHYAALGKYLRSRLRAQDLHQPAPRAGGHRRRRLRRPEHHPAPRRLCRRHRSFRHAGRRCRAGARAHAEEAPEGQRREAPLRAPLRAIQRPRSRRQRLRSRAEEGRTAQGHLRRHRLARAGRRTATSTSSRSARPTRNNAPSSIATCSSSSR